jgi:hypothetical protein
VRSIGTNFGGRCVVAALLGLSSLSLAQNASSNDQETISLLMQQIKELQQHDRELQKRVELLEAGQKQTEAAGTLSSTPEPPAPPLPQTTLVPPAEMHGLHGIQWRGFGEVNYKVLNQRTPELGTYGFVAGSAGNFYTGDFDLLLTSKINEKARVLSEIVFGEGDAQSFSVDLERVLLKYDYSDHLRISFGRYHTGIGYYNTAFHSGMWLQTAANRPLVMELANDGGLLPTQAVGLSLTGSIPSGRLGLNYIAEYGSSDTIRPDIDGSGHVDDEGNGNHVNLGFFLRPDAFPGLQIGGSFYHDKMTHGDSGLLVRFGQTIVNAHVVYTAHGFEILNEGFLLRHAPEHIDTVFNTPAFYTQFSKRIHRFRPFFRYQYVNASARGVYEDVLLRYGPSFGARFDFNDNIAFKTQLDHTVRKGQPDLNGLQMQMAFTF